MQKDQVIGALVLLVVAAGIIGYAALSPAPAKAPIVPVITAATSTLPEGGYTEHASYYDITTNYATSTPLLQSVGAAADTRVVNEMKDYISSVITQFKTDGNFANLTSEDAKTIGLDGKRKETLTVKYLIAPAGRTVSYIYTIYEDTLGAHGNIFFHTFTFDTTTGATLSLADLFTPSADYLASLSQISRAKLPTVIGDGFDINFIKDGTTPEAQNFQSFFFMGTDFVLLFPPYQVAPYSSGPQTLRIPRTLLYSVLKPEYR